MTDPAATESGTPDAASTSDAASEVVPVTVSPADVDALLDRIRLRQVRLVRWSGDAPPDGEEPVENVGARLEPASMRITPGDMSLWFQHRVDCTNAAGDVVAVIETGVVIDFDVEGDDDPELAVVACFADTNGAFMAWPYIREAVQSMSVRLGLAPITLGVLRRDEDAYGADDRRPESEQEQLVAPPQT